jgi:hypothetical protein
MMRDALTAKRPEAGRHQFRLINSESALHRDRIGESLSPQPDEGVTIATQLKQFAAKTE